MRSILTLFFLATTTSVVHAAQWKGDLTDSAIFYYLAGSQLTVTYDYPEEDDLNPGNPADPIVIPSHINSQIDLNTCISNLNGILKCPSGARGYTGSCQFCDVSQVGRLTCDCTDDDGDFDQASLDLDLCIKNVGGDLVCVN